MDHRLSWHILYLARAPIAHPTSGHLSNDWKPRLVLLQLLVQGPLIGPGRLWARLQQRQLCHGRHHLHCFMLCQDEPSSGSVGQLVDDLHTCITYMSQKHLLQRLGEIEAETSVCLGISQQQQEGIPEQYGIFFALGLALVMEGVLSGSYHICPTKVNFQFDTTFMYVIGVLLFLKFYQFR